MKKVRLAKCDDISSNEMNSQIPDDAANEDPKPSTSRSNVDEDDEDKVLGRLRNRKINLNRLSASMTCPQVCRFQHCGIQLRDGDQLEWHYQGHIAQEMEKLKKIRIKKSPIDQEEAETVRSRRRVRNSAVEKIRFHRERRLALARASTNGGQEVTVRPFECPVCQRSIVTEDDFSNHVEGCLRTAPAPPEIGTHGYESDVGPEGEEDGIDVDSMSGFETYTWAGQTRVRATSLVEGGLRGAGFMTITRGDEEGELDIENVDDEPVGLAQYSDADVILPNSDNAESDEDENERLELRNTLLKNVTENLTNKIADANDDVGKTTFDLANIPDLNCDLKKLVTKLLADNEELKKQTVCKICMDAVYNKPLVSLVCWHVHCEDCWLRALGSKKLCPQCKVIIQPKDLRRIYL